MFGLEKQVGPFKVTTAFGNNRRTFSHYVGVSSSFGSFEIYPYRIVIATGVKFSQTHVCFLWAAWHCVRDAPSADFV